jgi:hypothetical protein
MAEAARPAAAGDARTFIDAAKRRAEHLLSRMAASFVVHE